MTLSGYLTPTTKPYTPTWYEAWRYHTGKTKTPEVVRGSGLTELICSNGQVPKLKLLSQRDKSQNI
jgi:hypothetical protein